MTLSLNKTDLNNDDFLSVLKRRVAREQLARKTAEALLEARSLELFQANRELAVSQERFILAAQGSNDGIWDWNILTNETYYSNNWYKIIGYESVDFINTMANWMSHIHLHDRKIVRSAISIFKSKPQIPFICEYRMRHFKGHFIWVLTKGSGILDGQGNVIRMAGSQTDITHQKMIQKQLTKAAHYDKLTGLFNRLIFTERLSRQLQLNIHQDFAVLFIDLDGFKHINDTLGHNIGDKLLMVIARRLKECIREEDTLARWGGDEFTVLIQHYHSIEEIKKLSERLLKNISKSITLSGHEIFPQASIGITLASKKYRNADELLREADLAMYNAKANGKGKSIIFNKEMSHENQKRFNIETSMRKSYEKEEFILYYQPIVNLKTKKFVGFESLMRWNHPQLGHIMPSDFIKFAEESNIINLLGRYALVESCKTLKFLHHKFNNPHLFSSINVSARQLIDPFFAQDVDKIFKEYDINPTHIKLEITETTMVESKIEVRNTIFDLNNLGVKLSIDDFGTGYSSLTLLHQYPFDCVKIDRSFTCEVTENPKSQKLIKAITQMAKALEIETIIEGVETEKELEFSIQCDCDLGQGYYFSQPLDFENLQNYMTLNL
ncbi:MAG: putative bifunctional diguanylate cyclase/phosphodiesterase [Janthinobacterium lividum]